MKCFKQQNCTVKSLFKGNVRGNETELENGENPAEDAPVRLMTNVWTQK